MYAIRVRYTCTLYVYAIRVRYTCTLYVYAIRVRYTCTCSAQYYIRMASRCALQSRLSLDKKICETSVKIIKNEVGCMDDTVPKTVDTRRHCEEE